MGAKLTHIAVLVENAPRMREFYSGVFGLRPVSNRGAFLTDGYINFALIYRKPGYPAGLDHFGFEVDNFEEVCCRIKSLYPSVGVTGRPQHRGFAGYACHDPEGHVFDLSSAEMGERRRVAYSGGRLERTERRFHHLALRCLNPEAMARFYIDAIGLQLTKGPEGGNQTFHLTDGVMMFVLMPWVITDFSRVGIVEHPRLDHIGFSVESIAAYKRDLASLVERNPEAAPWAGHVNEQRQRDERAAREELLSRCEYNSSQLWDPECVLFDVRERSA